MHQGRVEALESRRLLATSFPVQIGGTDYDAAIASAVDSQGNLIVAGIFSGTVDFSPVTSAVLNLTSVGQSDIYIAKYSPNGVLTWVGQVGGGAGDFSEQDLYSPIQESTGEAVNNIGPTVDGCGEYISAIALGPDDSIYLTGSFQGTADFDPTSAGVFSVPANGYHDIFVLKLNADGTLNYASAFGGPFDDSGKAIDVDSKGNAAVTGYFTRNADFNPGKPVYFVEALGRNDAFVMQVSVKGKLVWLDTFGGDAVKFPDRDSGEAIAIDSNDNVIVTGSFAREADFAPGPAEYILEAIRRTDAFLFQLSPKGKLVWATSFGGREEDSGNKLVIASDDSFYVSGYFTDNADLDPSGGEANFNAENEGDFDGSDTNLFLSHFANNGAFISSGQFIQSGYSWLGDMKIDSADGIYITGGFSGQFDANPGAGTLILQSTEGDDNFGDGTGRDYSYDIFTTHIYPSGAVVAVTAGSTSDDYGIGIAIQPSGELLQAGLFKGTVSFNPATSSNNRRSNGLEDGFLDEFPLEINE